MKSYNLQSQKIQNILNLTLFLFRSRFSTNVNLSLIEPFATQIIKFTSNWNSNIFIWRKLIWKSSPQVNFLALCPGANEVNSMHNIHLLKVKTCKILQRVLQSFIPLALSLDYPAHIRSKPCLVMPLQPRHNERDDISNHQPRDCLLHCLFSRRSKKTSKLCVTGLCEGNSLVTSEFPTQRTSNVEHVSIWWRHHAMIDNNAKGPFQYLIRVSEWLNLMAFLGTVDSEVHIVHISHVIIAYTLESLSSLT